MREQNFWLYNMIGSIIWAISIIFLGVKFIDNYETILDNLGKIMMGVLILVIGYMYFFQREKLRNYMNEKQKEMEEKVAEKEQKKSSKKI
jgi:membrane protein DedA with SNARE-associated domain